MAAAAAIVKRGAGLSALEKLTSFRSRMADLGVQAFIIPTDDAHSVRARVGCSTPRVSPPVAAV
jgi:hypothetical protein